MIPTDDAPLREVLLPGGVHPSLQVLSDAEFCEKRLVFLFV